MTPTPTVERVAMAIALSGNGGTWDDWYNEDQREFHRKRARAAIEAMREPSEEMIGVGAKCYENGNPADAISPLGLGDAWRAMCDAALGRGGV